MEDKLKGLLIEDNPGDVRLIREMLAEVRGAPFNLECTDQLSTGLERLAAGSIDVVLLDLSLPDSQGLDTFIKVHAQASQVPIVVLTSLEDEKLAVEAVREGAQDYLVKGQVDGNLLARAMRYAIERKQVEEEIKRRNKELAVLNAIAATVSQSLDLTVRRLKESETIGVVTLNLTPSPQLDQVLRSIVDFATQLMPASTSGVIHLVDETARKLIPRAHFSLRGQHRGEIGHVHQGRYRRPRRAAEAVDQRPQRGERPPFPYNGHRCSLEIATDWPLLIEGGCIGTLSLNSDQVGAFSADDERLLTTLAAQAAVAVRNAWLHQEIQHRLDELIFLNQVGRTVTSIDLPIMIVTFG